MTSVTTFGMQNQSKGSGCEKQKQCKPTDRVRSDKYCTFLTLSLHKRHFQKSWNRMLRGYLHPIQRRCVREATSILYLYKTSESKWVTLVNVVDPTKEHKISTVLNLTAPHLRGLISRRSGNSSEWRQESPSAVTSGPSTLCSPYIHHRPITQNFSEPAPIVQRRKPTAVR